jgi:hypothetical protein
MVQQPSAPNREEEEGGREGTGSGRDRRRRGGESRKSIGLPEPGGDIGRTEASNCCAPRRTARRHPGEERPPLTEHDETNTKFGNPCYRVAGSTKIPEDIT